MELNHLSAMFLAPTQKRKTTPAKAAKQKKPNPPV
jgi:hypothetical protein